MSVLLAGENVVPRTTRSQDSAIVSANLSQHPMLAQVCALPRYYGRRSANLTSAVNERVCGLDHTVSSGKCREPRSPSYSSVNLPGIAGQMRWYGRQRSDEAAMGKPIRDQPSTESAAARASAALPVASTASAASRHCSSVTCDSLAPTPFTAAAAAESEDTPRPVSTHASSG